VFHDGGGFLVSPEDVSAVPRLQIEVELVWRAMIDEALT